MCFIHTYLARDCDLCQAWSARELVLTGNIFMLRSRFGPRPLPIDAFDVVAGYDGLFSIYRPWSTEQVR